jgi:hypothetical protein
VDARLFIFCRTPMWSHRVKGKPMPNNCKSPEMCLLSETCVPCAICPNVKEIADDRLARTPCSPSLPAKMRDLLHYEICAAWWPQFVSWGPLQDIIAGHFARKVAKKYRRWKWCVERSQRLSDLIPPNSQDR